ncbi:hypothetical protein B0T24DRAFT_588744 [Lasiosphaeria ovina]|uniref:Mitochondrial division protein 1 n=1 Tax=Lasiosphaeria ovina TaxID=92902 RepID=A0AAE0NM77_9PEZI|nr:hypothetical protein B0T24DRAFT_588744 [Lasiosphaeria ovina]
MKNMLARYGISRSFQHHEDPGHQDKLTTWIEYLAYQYALHYRYQFLATRRQPEYDEHLQPVVDHSRPCNLRRLAVDSSRSTRSFFKLTRRAPRFRRTKTRTPISVVYGGTPVQKDAEILKNKDTHPHGGQDSRSADRGRPSSAGRDTRFGPPTRPAMRLINVKTCKLDEFHDNETPKYAILSHTWGHDSEELTFRDVEEGRIDKPGIGSIKFRGSCQQAKQDKLGYVWIDTCCIDKTNLVELSEAINSMFRWYRRASVCYTYMSDVPAGDAPQNPASKFWTSRWFGRGWTLQELLAPKILRFYNAEWGYLGTKGTLRTAIRKITAIPIQILLGITELHGASVAQRMSWAAGRETKRTEDLAYCLLGIFGVTMPMIYGEGGDQAFLRLQDEIMKAMRDDSILAWGLGSEAPVSDPDQADQVRAGRILAAAPSDFAYSGHIVCREQSSISLRPLDMSGGSLRLYLSLLTTSGRGVVGLLACGPDHDPQQVVGIPLAQTASGASDEYVRPAGCHAALQPITASGVPPRLIYIRNDRSSNKSADTKQQYWLYDDAFAEINLDLVDVNPPSCWDQEQAMIQGTSVEPQCHVAICDRDTSLRVLAKKLEYVAQKTFGQSNITINITTELQKQDLILELTETMEAERQSNIKKEELKQEINDKGSRLEQVKREREIVEDGLRKLEERRGMLVEEESNGAEEIRLLSKRHAEVEAQQDQALKQWSRTLKRWDKLYHIDCDGDGCGLERMDNSTLICWAAENGHVEMVELLLSKGTDIAVANKDGWTPLIAASGKGHVNVVRLLVEKGVDINVRDKDNRTALWYALKAGNGVVVQLLSSSTCTWRLRQTLEGHSDLVYSVAFSPDSTVLASRSGDRTIRLWDTATGRLRQTLEGHSEYRPPVAFSPDSTVLVSGSSDKTIRLWDTATGRLRQTLEGHSAHIYLVAFSPDSTVLVSGSGDKTIRLWDAATGRLRQTLKGHSAYSSPVAFSPDSTVLASGSEDKTIRLWDAATGRLRQTLKGHSEFISSVAFSPDSTVLASGSEDKTIRLWDTATGRLRQTLKGHSEFISLVAFSPDSTVLVSGSRDKTIRLWDTATGQLRQTLEGHSEYSSPVAFSPDSTVLASGSEDKTIRLWDTVTGRLRQTLEGHSGRVNSVAFSPDSTVLASGSGDRTIRLWDTATGRLR